MKPAIREKNIIAEYNPSKVIFDLKECKTLPQCIKSNTPSLSILKKDSGEDKVLALLELWILDINDFFNMNNKMSPVQIKQTSLMLMQDFYYFKIADINFIFNNAKKGKYGQLYGSMDGSKIYQWFEKHDIDRAGESYLKALNEHDIERQNEKTAKSLVKTQIGKV